MTNRSGQPGHDSIDEHTAPHGGHDSSEGVGSQATTEPQRGSNKSRAIIITSVVVAALAFVAAIRVATDFANDLNNETAAKINAPSSSTEAAQEGGDPNEQLGGKSDEPKDKKRSDADKASKKHKAKKDYTNRDAGTPINDMTFPTTKSRAGTNIFRSSDRLTSDNAAIDSIVDLVNTAYQASANLSMGGDPLSLGAHDAGDAGHVAYMYFGGEQKVVAAMYEGAKRGWVLPNDKVYVFDHENPGVYKVAFQLSLPNGEPAYFVTGYYDPVVDSIQVASANLTEAGDQDLLKG